MIQTDNVFVAVKFAYIGTAATLKIVYPFFESVSIKYNFKCGDSNAISFIKLASNKDILVRVCFCISNTEKLNRVTMMARLECPS